ncbi:MAG: PIN domain-containing protein [Candidatus Altiarchaeota archaeon]|nr:PIN domain-containing protein [Candidatus Altiarchaeota archaeon]
MRNIIRIPNLTTLEINENTFLTGLKLSKLHGLLSNDSLHLAAMKIHEIKNLASNDQDFKRVNWIKQYAP